MPVLLQINSVVNSGSTGHIVENLGKIAIQNGWKSYVAYGRTCRETESRVIKIGSKLGIYYHVFLTRFLDLHGFGSYFASKKLIKKIKAINPDIIHLHNIHGYYINIKVLFSYLKKTEIPVIWTLHDCWAFTGHCSYYTFAGCNNWETSCKNCPQMNAYPSSFIDNSFWNYKQKKHIFTGLNKLTLVTPSSWLAAQVKKSFLRNYPVQIINNGIDLNVFRPYKDVSERIKELSKNKNIILGVASVWERRKGLEDFIGLAKLIDSKEYIFVLIGLQKQQINKLPQNIIGIERTENQIELAEWYSSAFVFFNPSIEETQGLTTIESLACGTPAIVYNSTAVPEALDEYSGFIVSPHNIQEVIDCIDKIKKTGRITYVENCRRRALEYYNRDDKFKEYFKLYVNKHGGM